MTPLLKHHINTQRLRADAPFPSQAEDAQDAIRQWRHEQLVRRLDSVVDSDVPWTDSEDVDGDER